MSAQKTIALPDLSGIFRRHWHATEHADIGAAFRRTIDNVTKISAGHDYTAVCIDRPPYRRKEIWSGYKAQREQAPQVMYEQLADVIAQLDRDGYHIFGADGYEADDIIATIVVWAQSAGIHVDIYSADKDLMQLVGDGVTAISTATGQSYDAAAVEEKFGVPPGLIGDMLALIGDKSDGIPGIKYVGDKTAAKWLREYGDLDGVLAAVGEIEPERFNEALLEQDANIILWRKLVELDRTAPIKPEIILERKMPTTPERDTMAEDPEPQEAQRADHTAAAAQPQGSGGANVAATKDDINTAITLEEPKESALDSMVASYDRALEPTTNVEAQHVAETLFKSRCFGDWPNAQAIMAVIMTGRGFGLGAVESVRGMHYVKGRITLSADLLQGVAMKHPSCKYFRYIGGDDKQATYETWRAGDPDPVRLTFTIEQAKRTGHVKPSSGWGASPDDMLRARCKAKLTRIVYPDVSSGLYTREEIEAAL